MNILNLFNDYLINIKSEQNKNNSDYIEELYKRKLELDENRMNDFLGYEPSKDF
jgi:hypothetical protein